MYSVLILSLIIHYANAYNVVGLFFVSVKSHYVFVQPLLSELARRNHTLTIYSVFPFDNQIEGDVSVIDVQSCFPTPIHGRFSISQNRDPNIIQTIQMIQKLTPNYEKIANCSPIMELVRSDEKYDALVTDLIYPEWFSLFAYKFQVPMINVFPNMLLPSMARLLGVPAFPSYVPHAPGFSTEITFFTRLINFFAFVMMTAMEKLFITGRANDVASRVFGAEAPMPVDVVRNCSLTLINTDLGYYRAPYPLVPNMVAVGGLHIKKAASVPENIEKFINESKHGVVYFCMGSLLRGETFPPEKREAFLYAFSKIPQRVLWKWEGDVLPGKSDNIMISKWMPQRDILAHPNVKLFISHGGLLGTSEAVYEGVPVLGIPIFGDQRTNIKSLEANGAGELLDYNEISKEVVLEKIQRLLNDPKYKENAKLLSDRYRDRPMSPLDTAVYWTEYVIRHKGAPHLRTAAADMPWYQYLLLDVIAFLVAVLIAGLLIVYYSIKFTLRFIRKLICGDKKSSSKSDKKKRN